MVVLALCVPTLIGLNWVLIFGHLGAPALGLAGCAYASALNQWLMVLGLGAAYWVLRRHGRAPRLRGEPAEIAHDIRRILALGLGIGGLQALEIGVFMTSAALMGLFGADPLGAHQIAINCASVTWMVPLGIGQAATVRVAAECGARAPMAARRAAFVAFALGVGFMACAAVLLWTEPAAIVGAYVRFDDPANRGVVAFALEFVTIAAVFQIVDGMQVVAAGALRGYHDTIVPMLIAGFGYWGIGFVGGWAFAFPMGVGPVGLWWGFVLGLATVAGLLTLRLWRHSRQEI
jgi:MATE family multidrug resistance protein